MTGNQVIVALRVKSMETSGLVHKVWGLGVDTIMVAPEPIALHPVRHLFPHVPENVFDTLVKKDIDVLIGMNFFSLHPSGGQGRNCVDNIRVLHSKFSKGWVVAGTHPDIQSSSPMLSMSALSIVKGFRVEVKPEFTADFWEHGSIVSQTML